MRDLMAILKALADEQRIRTLLALRGRELCVCQVTELLGLAPSTVSKHMSILRQAGLVESRKDGRWIYYRLPGDEASPEVQTALSWVSDTLAGDSRVEEDTVRLKQILGVDPEQLCRRQSRR